MANIRHSASQTLSRPLSATSSRSSSAVVVMDLLELIQRIEGGDSKEQNACFKQQVHIQDSDTLLALRFRQCVYNHHQHHHNNHHHPTIYLSKVVMDLSTLCIEHSNEPISRLDLFAQALAACQVQHVDLVASNRANNNMFPRHHNAIRKSIKQVAMLPTLESLSMHGKAFGPSSAVMDGICDALRQKRQSCHLNRITWAPSVACTNQENSTNGLTKLANALGDSHWQGCLTISSSVDATAWSCLIRLLSNPLVQITQFELHVTGLSLVPPPPPLTSALQQSTSLQSLMICGTSVLECWDVLPDNLTEILWRNRLLHHVQRLDPAVVAEDAGGHLAWLATRLVGLQDANVYSTPLYTLLRRYYVRPSRG